MAKRLTLEEKIQKEAEAFAKSKGFAEFGVGWYWTIEAYKAGAKRQTKKVTK